jgi:hypothetical protein
MENPESRYAQNHKTEQGVQHRECLFIQDSRVIENPECDETTAYYNETVNH